MDMVVVSLLPVALYWTHHETTTTVPEKTNQNWEATTPENIVRHNSNTQKTPTPLNRQIRGKEA
jgi:hypothetical protein